MGSAGSLRCLSAPLLVLVVYWCSIFSTFLVLSPNGRFGNRKKTAKVVEFRPLFISIKFLLFLLVPFGTKTLKWRIFFGE